MKKFVTLLVVAILAVSCVCALAACEGSYSDEVLAHEGVEYTITGAFNGWGLNFDENDATKLDAKYTMKAVALTEEVLKPIRKDLRDSNGGAKYVYIIEHVCLDEGAGWDFSYALTEGAELTKFDGNQAIKVLRATFNADGADWEYAWLPDAGGTTFRSLTPDTLYMPPHSEAPTYEGSGAWNDNPGILKAGTYTIVFAAFNDGTFGLGAIAK